ncbi:MAG: extracellular solute-binding protein [Lachnospiraceae bacterium]|nr:extracellular solute-binding protein [Lachnospiraceae bacterium]
MKHVLPPNAGRGSFLRPIKGSALLLSAVLLLGGCADQVSQPSSDAASEQETIEISIGYWNIDRMADVQKDAMRDYVEERFAISISPVSVDWTNYKDYYQMLSATNSLPDVFATLTISSNDANDSAYYENLIESGSIQPLPDDLSAYPNLERMMEQMEYTRYEDGHFYAIPRVSFIDPTLACTDAALIVRRDWMENLGLDDPQNLDEFIELIAAFANDDPDGNGIDDTIGYNVNAQNALGKWVMLGIAPECNTYSWIERDGLYIPSWYSEDFYDVVCAYRTMYETGGLDPDFYIKNPNEVIEDFASGRLGAIEFKSAPSSCQQIEEQWNLYNTEPFEECVDILPIFAAPDGTTYCNSSTPFWSESFISADVDEEKMHRILSLFDYLLSDEGNVMSKYGLEDVDYRVDKDGTYTCLLDTENTSLLDLLEKKYPSITLFGGLATWGGSDTDFELNEMNFARYGKHCVVLGNKDVTWNRANATPVERPYDFLIFPKESSELFSTANAFSEFVKCIIGDGDPETMWKEAIQNLKDQGLDNYIQRQNDAYLASLGNDREN